MERSLNLLTRRCLRDLCISRISEWDVLVFLHQHGTTLLDAEQISKLLGYSKTTISNALDRLETRGLITQSHFSRGVRRYELAEWQEPSMLYDFEFLTAPKQKRSARLCVARELRHHATLVRVLPRTGLHFA